MSIVKRALSFGGYGQSKPVISYHTQNSDSVTTVVTEISHMSLNEKQAAYNGAGAVQKTASLTELCSEDAEVQKHVYGQQPYGSDVGGFDALVRDNAAQKDGGYGEQKASSYQHESGAGGYSAHHHESSVQKHGGYGGQKASSYQHGGYDAVSHDSTGATQKHGYGEQKAYQHGAEAHHDSSVQKHGYGALHHQDSKVQKSGYGGEHTAYQHEGNLKGYTALHQDSKVQKHGYGEKAHGYGEQKAYDSAVQKHGYGEQKAYDSAVQKHGYGEQKAYQHGAEAHQHGYGEQKHNAYPQQGSAGGYVAGYDARQMQKQQQYNQAGCESDEESEEESDCEESEEVRQMQKQQYNQAGCESDEESEEESDSEEEVLGHGGYGVHKYPTGSTVPGGTQYYSAYERRQQLGGGSHYEAYESSTTQGYSGGCGYGGGWAQPKNHSYY